MYRMNPNFWDVLEDLEVRSPMEFALRGMLFYKKACSCACQKQHIGKVDERGTHLEGGKPLRGEQDGGKSSLLYLLAWDVVGHGPICERLCVV